MAIQTRVALAKKDTRSMKTTIPEAIVEYLQLQGKDTLEWQMGTKDNEAVALVRRKENLLDQPQNFDEIKVNTRRRLIKGESLK